MTQPPRAHRPIRPLLAALGLVMFTTSGAGSFWFGVHFLGIARARSEASHYPIAAGYVVCRSVTPIGRGIRRPLLQIVLLSRPDTVLATLTIKGAGDIPDTITFHFDGNPKHPVYLVQDGPVWPAALLCLVGTVLFLTIPGLVLYKALRRANRAA